MNFKKKIYSNFRIEINNNINYYINIIRNKSIKLFKKNFSLKYENIKSSIIDYEYFFPVKEAEYIYHYIINKYILDKNGMYLFFINGFYVFNFFKKKYLLSINDIIINNKNYCNSNIEKYYGKSISNNDTLNYLIFSFQKMAHTSLYQIIFFLTKIYILYIYIILIMIIQS